MIDSSRFNTKLDRLQLQKILKDKYKPQNFEKSYEIIQQDLPVVDSFKLLNRLTTFQNSNRMITNNLEHFIAIEKEKE